MTKVTADTLEELAAKLDGVDAARRSWRRSRAYNAAVRTDVPFDPNVKDGRGTVGLASRSPTGPTARYAALRRLRR